MGMATMASKPANSADSNRRLLVFIIYLSNAPFCDVTGAVQICLSSLYKFNSVCQALDFIDKNANIIDEEDFRPQLTRCNLAESLFRFRLN
jgi:hypothetical protein